MPNTSKHSTTPSWVSGEIKLVRALDKRVIKLLESIDEGGSISQAARVVGLSYKGAWQILEHANNLAPYPLITSATGGYMGGGTTLTSSGKALLDLFKLVNNQYELFLQQLNQSLTEDALTPLLLEPLSIKSSARNQLLGRILVIQPSLDAVDVMVQLIGGERICATLSFAELDDLQLDIGCAVLLLIDDQATCLLTDYEQLGVTVRNALHCSVSRIRQQDENYEVTLRLIGGDHLQTLISPATMETMALKPGTAARLMFNSSDVLVAAKI
ncbi:TOBE domain-containing protein [Methylomonas paludis]|uniref:TOBE domain-containing protein n=1 Tax=Methylomonas paludis TaxID=1173101 RepID=A0A975MKW1_9GAMM|nr:TOBE domain-containing protein [Methylomonas paludis]QWF69685.1 TOBE domain-containing protein [Methylomonas paludis]